MKNPELIREEFSLLIKSKWIKEAREIIKQKYSLII